MRSPNGYGTIKKLSGKRRRPFAVYVTTGFELSKPVPDIEFLKDILDQELFEQVLAQYNTYKASAMPKARQKQQCIGYYATRPEAMIALAEFNKNPFDVNKAAVTFGEIYDILYQSKIKDMKKSNHNAYVSAFKKCDSLAGIRMREMRTAHMQKVMDENSTKSKSTLNNINSLFHMVYNFCLENDICEKDYSKFVKMESEAERKKKMPYTKEEIKTVWENIGWIRETNRKNALNGVPMVDSLIVMLYTGMRIGELLALKPKDVHLEDRWVKVDGTKTKAADRVVPIHKKILPLLEKRMKQCKGEFLFGDVEGNEVPYNNYLKLFFEPFNKELKFKHTPHECRHTFATVAAASSMNKVLLKKIIGHASNDITEDIYTHAYVEDLVKEIDKFDL